MKYLSIGLIVLFLIPNRHLAFDGKITQYSIYQEDLLSRIDSILELRGLRGSDTKPRNFGYKILSQVSNYSILHASRYVTNNKSYVDCVVYKYENMDTAQKTFKNVKELEYLDSMFKDYNFFFQSQDCLVLIKTGCNQDGVIWKEVIEEVLRTDIVNQGAYIKCTCGGNCSFF